MSVVTTEPAYYQQLDDALLMYAILAHLQYLDLELDLRRTNWYTIGERQDMEDVIDQSKELYRRLMERSA